VVTSLQRIPISIDPFGVAGTRAGAALTQFRTAAATKVYLGLEHVKANLSLVKTALEAPRLPPVIVGSLLQHDGVTPGINLQVQFDPAANGATGSIVTAVTSDTGLFTLAMPTGATIPSAGLSLVVHGANGNQTVTVAAARIAANGLIGTMLLAPEPALKPVPLSILAALKALVPAPGTSIALPSAPPAQLPKVTLGEAGSICSQSFSADPTIDTFPYGVFFRLVEPQMSIVSEVFNVQITGGGVVPLTVFLTTSEQTSFADRVPVQQPISADGFLDQIAGLNAFGVFTAEETVPMAATLGLGYILWLSQQWTFKGLGLGDLVYSLPLAPGEQTQVAVFERTDTAAVYESESFSEQQTARQQATSDSSTLSTFNSAFAEASAGGSAFQTESSSSSWGGSLILISGGGGSSQSSGSSTEWLQGQRDSAQRAAETTHSSAENQASARRTASRTGMRLANATESESVTTKTITNHNHTHALTMQYWQVLRNFNVTTGIDGLTLTCLIPMQIVRFMPPGQPEMLKDATKVTRDQLITRYANVVKHLDVLQNAVPRRFQYGLKLLEQFASDPAATVEPEGSVAEDVIHFTLTGSFLACENVSVVAVTRRNTRIGPVQLAPAVNGQPPEIPLNRFVSHDDLLGWLLGERQSSSCQMQGSLALPATLNRSDVVGFEITRSWKAVHYTLFSPMLADLTALKGIVGVAVETAAANWLGVHTAPETIKLSARDLEPALGGPNVTLFTASLEELDANGQVISSPTESYVSDPLSGTVLPLQPYPVPALQIAPVLRYHEILEIEKAAHHVVRNTTLYSKAVWASLSPEERAIMLDGYTIGVPTDGVGDASDLVPLLNCVQNKLLGFFGNSMIMPFIIPQAVAEGMGINPAEIVQGLLAYQRATFVPPQATIALPTHGVLGEAVLGHCSSAEKIDLTRFWNWQDAPADTAPTISPVTLPTTAGTIAGLAAPNSLTNLPPLINNVLQAPVPNTSLLQALGADAAAQKDFSDALTGAAQLAPLLQSSQTLANDARASALQTTQQLTSQAMATIANLYGGLTTGNPNAGGTAAAGLKGVLPAPPADPKPPAAGAAKPAGSGTAKAAATDPTSATTTP
jgi:hypothetical protein